MTDLANSVRQIVDGLSPPEPGAENNSTTTSAPKPVNLPDDFWQARPRLALIRSAAHARARSADALLGVVLARVSAATTWQYFLPAIVGSMGSLNVAVALIGNSGDGKSSTKRLAAEMVPIDDETVVDDLAIGSGEGLIEAYFEWVDEPSKDGKTTVRVKKQTKQSVFAYLDEGQALEEMGRRKGSTLLPTLRSAWTGDTLGQANASEDRRRRLDATCYRFACVVGFQPDHAVRLLDDAPGGTPQRFLWLSANDPTIPYNTPEWPGPLDWKPPPDPSLAKGVFLGCEIMGVPEDIRNEIRRSSIARTRGEETVDELDAHHDYGRLKVAGLLAILDDRVRIDHEDWDLAGVVMDTSLAVRSSVADHGIALAANQERQTTSRLVRRQGTLDESAEIRALDRMARTIARHVHKRGHDCKKRCATQATRGSDRHLATIDEAVDRAVDNGWVTVDGDTYRPGKARPA